MVEVGVGEDDRVERRRGRSRAGRGCASVRRSALEHAAVDEDPGAPGVDEVARPGDRSRAAEKGELHGADRDTATHRGAGSWNHGRMTGNEQSRPRRGGVPRGALGARSPGRRPRPRRAGGHARRSRRRRRRPSPRPAPRSTQSQPRTSLPDEAAAVASDARGPRDGCELQPARHGGGRPRTKRATLPDVTRSSTPAASGRSGRRSPRPAPR